MAFRRPGTSARNCVEEDTSLYGRGPETLLFISVIKVLAIWRSGWNEISKPRNVNGNFGTSDLRRTTYPVKTEKKKKRKYQISDDQLKPKMGSLKHTPGRTAAGSAWAREDP
jgi:hypothetical protein